MASVAISSFDNIANIISLAGADPGYGRVAGGQLFVEGATQSELDDAYAVYESDRETYECIPAREKKVDIISHEANDYATDRYSMARRDALLMLYVQASTQGLDNRLAYIQQLFDWANTIMVHVITCKSELDVLLSSADIAAYTWDFTAFDLTDPDVTVGGALAIGD
jgi:hypothetical protein